MAMGGMGGGGAPGMEGIGGKGGAGAEYIAGPGGGGGGAPCGYHNIGEVFSMTLSSLTIA